MFADWSQHQNSAGVHHGITCDGCEQSPVIGTRYRSLEWSDYDLCESCHGSPDRRTTLGVTLEHSFEAIPAPEVSESSEGMCEDGKGWGRGCHWAKGWGKQHPCKGAWKGKALAKGMWPMFADWSQHQNSVGVHHGITCDGCEQSPVIGTRYRSL